MKNKEELNVDKRCIDECWICGNDVYEGDMYIEVVRKMKDKDDSIVGRYCIKCSEKNVAGVCVENLRVD